MSRRIYDRGHSWSGGRGGGAFGPSLTAGSLAAVWCPAVQSESGGIMPAAVTGRRAWLSRVSRRVTEQGVSDRWEGCGQGAV